MTWKHAISRSGLRLASALVMLTFVICHLTAHAFLLVSLETAGKVLDFLMFPWRTLAGTVLLTAAFVVHFSNALWSIYIRRSLRLIRWEWAQLSLGLCIPALLIPHIVSARIAASVFDVTTYYSTVFIVQWVMFPWLAAVQMIAVLTVWTHACIGIHFWLRTKPWYPSLRIWLFGFALLLPALALAGYVTGGNQVLREAKNPDFVSSALEDSNLTDETMAGIRRIEHFGWGIYLALVLLPFAARGIRGWYHRRRRPPMLAHAGGRSVPILPGATVLETLRENGIAHASVCGGRARCTTCRILVTKGLDRLPAASGLEAIALDRIGGTPGMRLACQIRPTADIAVMPLLAADAGAIDGSVRGGLEGRERPITVVFVDMRGSTTLGEAKLPYDVLFILNQFFHDMTKALVATNGHYSQFTGDGLDGAVRALRGRSDARRGRCVARRARDAGGPRSAELPAAQRSQRAAADRHRHPLRRSHRRRHGAAALANHHRNRRHGEHLRAAGKPDQGIRLRDDRVAARGRGRRPRHRRLRIAASAGQGPDGAGRVLHAALAVEHAGVTRHRITRGEK